MTEMNLVEMCYRMTQVQRALNCTKEFSIKFNGHLKLITSLVNSLYEEEESLMLYEQKIERHVDHYHQRIIFKKTRSGDERVTFEGSQEEQEGYVSNRGWGVHGEYGDVSNNPSGMKNFIDDKTANGRRSLRGHSKGEKGTGAVGTWNGDRKLQEGRSAQNGDIGSRSVEHLDVGYGKTGKQGGRMNFRKRGNQIEIQSEYQSQRAKGYRQEMESLTGMNEQGKRGALVNDLRFATVDSIEDGQIRNSEEAAMSRKLDMFMKESDFLKEVIKNGEDNAKHLKDCLFKMIDAFKNKKEERGIKEERIERIEKITKIEGEVRLNRIRT